jgi:hypothetical protein
MADNSAIDWTDHTPSTHHSPAPGWSVGAGFGAPISAQPNVSTRSNETNGGVNTSAKAVTTGGVTGIIEQTKAALKTLPGKPSSESERKQVDTWLFVASPTIFQSFLVKGMRLAQGGGSGSAERIGGAPPIHPPSPPMSSTSWNGVYFRFTRRELDLKPGPIFAAKMSLGVQDRNLQASETYVTCEPIRPPYQAPRGRRISSK